MLFYPVSRDGKITSLYVLYFGIQWKLQYYYYIYFAIAARVSKVGTHVSYVNFYVNLIYKNLT